MVKTNLQNSKSDRFAIHIMRKSKKLPVIDVFKLFRAILKITFLSKKLEAKFAMVMLMSWISVTKETVMAA